MPADGRESESGYVALPGPVAHLEIGGFRVRVESGGGEFLPARYAPFLTGPGEADWVVRTTLDVEPSRPEGEVVFAHRPFWVLRREGGGVRRYESLGREGEALRTMRVLAGGEVELSASPRRRVVLGDHPEIRWLGETLLDDPLDQLLWIDRLTESRAGLVLHGAALARGDSGFLFAGHSGKGKSTLSRGVRSGTVLTDDRPIVRTGAEGFTIHGTPWYGELGLKSAGSARLEGVYLIDREGEPGVRAVDRNEAFRELLHVAFPTYWDREGLEFALDRIDRLVAEVPVAKFSFRPGEDALARILGPP